MIHKPDVGTFAPGFTTMDEAEEFSNALRVGTDFSVAEPIPLVKTETTQAIEHNGKIIPLRQSCF